MHLRPGTNEAIILIPKRFECMGFTINVKMDEMSDCGKWHPDKQLIRIAKGNPDQVTEQTFWHEFMHCALSNLSYDELDSNEQFVDQMAQCLYQLEKTRK